MSEAWLIEWFYHDSIEAMRKFLVSSFVFVEFIVSFLSAAYDEIIYLSNNLQKFLDKICVNVTDNTYIC